MLLSLRRYIEDRKFRRVYPWLYDDELQHQALMRLLEPFNGKTVALVGNAQSIFDYRAGAAIDAADVVIRLNEGFPVKPDCQGTRTDILCLATPTDPDIIRRRFGDPAVIFVSPYRCVMSSKLAVDGSVAVLPFIVWHLISMLLGYARPSAGLMAIWIARNFIDAPTVNLYGFDWKATKTFYADKKRTKNHDWIKERRLIEKWAAEGGLALPAAS